jgi:hypothetical protein
MNPRTTNLMMDGELSLSTIGILHSLNPLNHKGHRHHHPLVMKINPNPNAHSRNLPILDMQASIGRFANPTIVLTTEEINLGIVEDHKDNHSEIKTTLLYANSPCQTTMSETPF